MKRSATNSEDNAKKSKGDVSSENNNDNGTNLNDEAQSNATANAGNELEGRNDPPLDVDADPPLDVDALLAKEFEFDIPTMKRDVAVLKNSIFEEGLLSPERFQQMEEFEHEKYKNYIHKFFDIYFERAFKLHAEIDEVLTNLQLMNAFTETKTVVEDYIKDLKDITESVGALKVLNEIDNMARSCEEGDLDGVKSAFEKVEEENEKLRNKVDPYFKLVFRIEFKENIPMEQQIARELGVEWQGRLTMSYSPAAIRDDSSSSSEGSSSPREESSSSSEDSSSSSEESSEGSSSETEEIDVLSVTK